MKILVTGCCGFAGSRILARLSDVAPDCDFVGIDNLSRPGSEVNRSFLQNCGIDFAHGDLRFRRDIDRLPRVDWVVDAAANPSVLAGVDGKVGSRQLVEHNLLSTVNLLEYCRQNESGFTLLSTSRVYSIEALTALPLERTAGEFVLASAATEKQGVGSDGITEAFSTSSPLSLYGGTKLASEALALEYQAAFDFPVWINRCGILAGAGQFGKPDQGIVAFWIHSWAAKAPLRYIGYNGRGLQVRDCLHPSDLADLLLLQIRNPSHTDNRIANVSGGIDSRFSLAGISSWCVARFGRHEVETEPTERPFDIPWLVLDSSLAQTTWDWKPTLTREQIFAEVADFAEANPNWLALSHSD
jgi:CDP-paratose 2-epimerase